MYSETPSDAPTMHPHEPGDALPGTANPSLQMADKSDKDDPQLQTGASTTTLQESDQDEDVDIPSAHQGDSAESILTPTGADLVLRPNAGSSSFPPMEADPLLPVVQVRPSMLTQTLEAADAVLVRAGNYFHRGGAVVCVRVDPLTKAAVVQEMTGQSLMVALARMSSWARYHERTGSWTAIDPCSRICRLLAEFWDESQLPVISGTAHQPFLRSNATLCTEPGYDLETGLFGLFDTGTLTIPDSPTREQASRALELLDDLLAECAFAQPEDRAAALSALLTAAVRPSLSLAPMFHVMAHQSGSGKSFLCKLITAVATPSPGATVAFPQSNDACHKLLLSQLMKAPAVIEFDNLGGDLRPFDTLCSALTSERLEGRQLGQSRTVIVGTKTLFLSSGNNVRPVEDMVRRCITIHLDPGMEAPATRVFKRPNLLDDVRRDRTKYVAAALTIIRAWVLAGRPQHPASSLAGYSAWSDWCRQPLLWLGQADPASRVFQGLKEDPAQMLLGRVLHGWHQTHGSSPKMVRDIVKSAVHLEDTDDFRDALIEAAGGNESINARKLGHWLSRNEGKIAGVYRLRRAAKTRNAESWEVAESVRSVPSVLESPMS